VSEWFKTFMAHFTTESSMALLLFILIIGVVAALLKLHFNDHDRLDLEELVLTNDKIDEQKFMRFGAWIISTWGFVYLIVVGNLTEWYFVGYIGVWVSNAIFDKYLNNKNQQMMIQQSYYNPNARYNSAYNPNASYNDSYNPNNQS
jgi:hypothetical protein